MRGDFTIGRWLVQPSVDRVESDGVGLHLRPKTMQVLVELAERAGEVVGRDELQHRVWDDVHIAEESLSHCIAEIRSALGDDAHQPTYVETVAKHGYRLIAPVDRDPERRREGGERRPGHPRRLLQWPLRRVVAVAALAGLAAAALGAFGWRAFKVRPSHPPQFVVVADWENRTGEPVFDDTLRQALAMILGESRGIQVVSHERAAHALGLMRLPATSRLSADLARQVCRRVGADLVAAGDIARVGGQFAVTVEVTGCASATPIAQIRATTAGRDTVLGALDRIGAELGRRLGQEVPKSAGGRRPVEDVTTANLEALRAFTLAGDALAERKAREAIALYDHAIELDPEFALAHSRLGSTLAGLREWKHANEHRQKAMALASGLTERERLYVRAAYLLGQGRVAQAEDTLRAWTRLYPTDRIPLSWLAVSHLNRGEQVEALSWGQGAVNVDPTPGALITLACVYLNSGRVADARSVTAGLSDPGFRYVLAFLDGDTAEMGRLRSAVGPGSAEELDMRAREAQAAMAAGRVMEGRHLLGRVETLGLHLGLLELTAQVLATHAVWEAEIGDPHLAGEIASAALSMADDASTRALAVLTFARIGAVVRARAVVKRIESIPADVDSVIAAGCTRKLAAAVALAEGRHADALQQLEGLRPYEDGGVVNHVALRGDVAELGVLHLRGLARLALRQGAEAATEFRRITERRSVSPLSPYCALAPLNLARALVIAGDRAGARVAYESFLHAWSGADSGGPLLAAARREHRRVAEPPAVAPR